MITVQEAASALDQNQYRREGSSELWEKMKKAGLVAVFGASDDLMEFRGAINDEVGAYGGTKALVTSRGLLVNRCDDDRCPYHAEERRSGVPITAVWGEGGYSWQYNTPIPHTKFVIMEDDDTYCEGIVFALSDVP